MVQVTGNYIQKELFDFTNRKYRAIDLFAGIGGIRLGFQQAFANNIEFVFSSEIDRFARMTYQANFSEEPQGDLTTISPLDIPPFDILLAGFPCQPFSNAGLKKGFEDARGTLFFDIAKIIEAHQPEIIFLENVKNFRTHDQGNTFKVVKEIMEKLGYQVYAQVFNAKHFGVPQNRERIYIVAFSDQSIHFEFPVPPNSSVKVGDILEKNVASKYTISDRLWQGHQKRKREHKRKGNGFGYSLFNNHSPYTSTISARYYKDGSEILIEQEGKNPRKLTPKEAARLQGFPDTFEIPVSDTQAYKQFGNSVAVPVIHSIASQIMSYLPIQRQTHKY
ncbi:DNA-cytosine methyltransferase [Halothece sp. PCC 7418]|uniref:DNA cytosine methyltransferase n=1 Tax=Halothece sp. (strain PCC 7418) TaxID=65093 RepID=UPI0002A08DCC|nr:DNA cytosine methyltransferase [Halothece sp. PCC 7418]AFZ43627.1 DNA-cytosine methyltransferase [Halothece sp. PCC 7418]